MYGSVQVYLICSSLGSDASWARASGVRSGKQQGHNMTYCFPFMFLPAPVGGCSPPVAPDPFPLPPRLRARSQVSKVTVSDGKSQMSHLSMVTSSRTGMMLDGISIPCRCTLLSGWIGGSCGWAVRETRRIRSVVEMRNSRCQIRRQPGARGSLL